MSKTANTVGLTEEEAKKRIDQYGLNLLAQKNNFDYIRDFLSIFFSPLVLLLLGASIISAAFGNITDFIIIFSIVLLSGLVSFWQHFKAEKTAQQLKQKVRLNATVFRDGIKKEIPFSHVTVGDVIYLTVGDLIPADAEFLEAKDITVDEVFDALNNLISINKIN